MLFFFQLSFIGWFWNRLALAMDNRIDRLWQAMILWQASWGFLKSPALRRSAHRAAGNGRRYQLFHTPRGPQRPTRQRRCSTCRRRDRSGWRVVHRPVVPKEVRGFAHSSKGCQRISWKLVLQRIPATTKWDMSFRGFNRLQWHLYKLLYSTKRLKAVICSSAIGVFKVRLLWLIQKPTA